MPKINFTVPDSSPWITYQGVWGDSDSGTQFYTNGTFHFTQDANATASFTFNGTGFWLVGAKRPNHGAYTVTFDHSSVTKNGTTTDDPGDFNVTLFALSDVLLQERTIQLANPVAGKFLDLDFAIIEVGDGVATTSNHDFWMDDTHPNVTYDSTWPSGNNSLNHQYFNSSFHLSSSTSGSATVSFNGNQVALYGASSGNHGLYSVALDGQPAQKFNGSAVTFRPQQLLYFASNLPSGDHKVVLTNLEEKKFTDFDFAIVTTYDSQPGGSSSSASSGAATGTGTGDSTGASTSTDTGASTSSSAPDSSATNSAVHRSRVSAAVLGALALSSVLVSAL